MIFFSGRTFVTKDSTSISDFLSNILCTVILWLVFECDMKEYLQLVASEHFWWFENSPVYLHFTLFGNVSQGYRLYKNLQILPWVRP